MFMALRQKAGIWLSKKQRLLSWGDAETQHLCPPSSLAIGTALSPCLFSLSSLPAQLGRGSQNWACCSLFSLGLFFLWLSSSLAQEVRAGR